MTNFRRVVMGLAILAGTMATVAATAGESRSTLRVTVDYKGAGTVGPSNRVWIWLFDTPDFASGAAMPVAERSLTENGATAEFTGLPPGPVWVAVAYDSAGGFAGSGPPPSGSPVGTHVENGAPAPVETGTDAAITIVFDDSTRMP